MSAAEQRLATAEERQPFWLRELFWSRLNHIETHHLQVQSQHEAARRGLDAVQRSRSVDLFDAWKRYCEVIAELDRTTAELEVLRTRPE
jgi:hypothetical protein